MQANSIAIYPEPKIPIFLGISLMSRISLEVKTLSSPGIIFVLGLPPVAITIFFPVKI